MNVQLFVACLLLAAGVIQARTSLKRRHHARQTATACRNGQVKCATSDRCIAQSHFCDGFNDCGDDSDEPKTCPKRPCIHDNTVRCPTRNRCISVADFCNGYNDCSDNSDEDSTYCSTRTCPEGYLKCNNGQCISTNLYCNDGHTCSDNTTFQTRTVCQNFACVTGATKCQQLQPTQCFAHEEACNGYRACQDGSDEPDNCRDRVCPAGQFKCIRGQCVDTFLYCTNHAIRCNDFTDMSSACVNVECPEGYVKCPSDGACIRNDQICDGGWHCSDNWDESNEQCHEPLVCSSDKPICPGVRLCMDERFFCDTDNDCGDASDEDLAYCDAHYCGVDEVRCDNGQCLKKDAFCGQQTQCRDGSMPRTDDICTMTTPCPNGTARCPGQRRCINAQYFCDGDDDCGDRSDEDPTFCSSSRSCAQNEVRCNSGQCLNKDEFCSGFISCRDNSTLYRTDVCSTFIPTRVPPPRCLMTWNWRVQRCVEEEATAVFAGVRPSEVLQKVLATDLRVLCSHAQNLLGCGENAMKYCDEDNSLFTNVIRRYAPNGRKALDYVCSQEVDVLNSNKACLLRTVQTRHGIQLVLPMAIIIECIQGEESFTPPPELQPFCLPRSLQACAKRIVTSQCGDEVAKVLDGLAEFARQAAKCPESDHHGPPGNMRSGRGFQFNFDAFKSFF